MFRRALSAVYFDVLASYSILVYQNTEEGMDVGEKRRAVQGEVQD